MPASRPIRTTALIDYFIDPSSNITARSGKSVPMDALADKVIGPRGLAEVWMDVAVVVAVLFIPAIRFLRIRFHGSEVVDSLIMNKGIETSSLYPLFSELTRLETELWDALDSSLRKEHGLPMSRFEPMAAIDRLGACRVFDVATALAITVGGTSKLIDRIEKAGYCRRRNNPDDRRSSLIELTADGRMLLERAKKTVEAELDLRLNPVLTEQNTDDLLDLLGRLRTASRLAAAERPN